MQTPLATLPEVLPRTITIPGTENIIIGIREHLWGATTPDVYTKRNVVPGGVNVLYVRFICPHLVAGLGTTVVVIKTVTGHALLLLKSRITEHLSPVKKKGREESLPLSLNSRKHPNLPSEP